MIVSCARCGHVAGAMCPHCDLTEHNVNGEFRGGRYCLPGCFELMKYDQDGLDQDEISELNPPMTPEEEEMHSAYMGVDSQDSQESV